MSDTNIPVTDAMWNYLNGIKGRGETYDEVLRRETDFEESETAAHTAHD